MAGSVKGVLRRARACFCSTTFQAVTPSTRALKLLMSNTVGGIDFGTSNSSIGYLAQGRPSLIRFGDDGYSVPSAIFYATEGPEVAYGKRAVALYTDAHEGRLLRSLKSVLGSSLMGEKTVIRNQRVAFSDIIEDFFSFLKASLSNDDGQSVSRVVVGRPVRFVDDDDVKDRLAERQLHDIAKAVGFSDVEFQLEPIAAALDYEQGLRSEQLALVVDIGGGTADFSIIRLSPDRHQLVDRSQDILATSGVHIGGTDFDRLLSLQTIMPLLGMGSGVRNSTRLLPQSVYFDLATWHRIPLLYNNATSNTIRQMQLDAVDTDAVQRLMDVVSGHHGHALAQAVEASKIALSMSELTGFSLEVLDQALTRQVKRAEFEQAIDDSVARLLNTVAVTLQDAQLGADQITSVFYTGGSSSIPMLQRQFADLFKQATQVRGDVFGSVGMGLTIDAARRFA